MKEYGLDDTRKTEDLGRGFTLKHKSDEGYHYIQIIDSESNIVYTSSMFGYTDTERQLDLARNLLWGSNDTVQPS